MRLDGGRISEIGPWSECSNQSDAEDLGEVILMPGLVNAHCHLNYTDFVGAIPSTSFTEWIRAIVDLKADVDDAALQASWLRGAQQCLNHGITTLGNIETRRDLLPDLWSQTPLRMVSFLEIILLQPESDVEQELKELQTWIRGIHHFEAVWVSHRTRLTRQSTDCWRRVRVFVMYRLPCMSVNRQRKIKCFARVLGPCLTCLLGLAETWTIALANHRWPTPNVPDCSGNGSFGARKLFGRIRSAVDLKGGRPLGALSAES